MPGFFRFQASPAYGSLAAFYADIPLPDGRQQYAMPLRPGDTIRFVIDRPMGVDPAALKIGLATGSALVANEIGTVVGSDDHLFIQAEIPSDTAYGCYHLLIHGQADNSTAWVYQSHTCEVDEFGRRTGWAEVTETRNATYAGFALLRSQVLSVAYHPETTVVEFSDPNDVFGTFYSQNPGFVQKLRLHLSLSKPRPTVAESTYRLTNGSYRNQNVSIGKKYLLTTGHLDEATHDALAVALKHENFKVEGRNFAAEGIFEAEFVELAVNMRRHSDLYQASVEVFDEDFYKSNIDCVSDSDIDTPCPNQYDFEVTQKIGVTQTGPNAYQAAAGQLINLFVTVTPFGGAVQYTYSGQLPPGVNLILIENGIAIVGIAQATGTFAIVLKAKNGNNTCGSLLISIGTTAASGDTTEYAAPDYNAMDYN